MSSTEWRLHGKCTRALTLRICVIISGYNTELMLYNVIPSIPATGIDETSAFQLFPNSRYTPRLHLPSCDRSSDTGCRYLYVYLSLSLALSLSTCVSIYMSIYASGWPPPPPPPPMPNIHSRSRLHSLIYLYPTPFPLLQKFIPLNLILHYLANPVYLIF